MHNRHQGHGDIHLGNHNPSGLDTLISGAIDSFLDMDQYDLMIEEEERGRESIRETAQAILITGHDE